ncbi:MAG TPA: (Fe-S)-binding protein [Actinomycetota bacterium]|jgi:glycolate oxidase iron-sulfur subunit|nr:(Fe-S)-binding protein [Actinomycetota bacterium]
METPLGTELPAGTRFIGPEEGWEPNWGPGDAPTKADLDACVACGLCLPHCPTYRLTGEESASPRGRIAAMRAVHEGRAATDDTFARFMDLCLVCRACEDVCPSHVPFGRMMERARTQVEPHRWRRARFVRRLGLDVVLPSRTLTSVAAGLAPLARPFLPRRIRSLVPRGAASFGRLPEVTEAEGELRGTVALLAGCVQDRWFRRVNLATIHVLARNGWRVVVPRGQTCCGALAAHNGHLGTARKQATRNARAFASFEHVIVNAAGCGAHMADYGDLVADAELPVHDVMKFLSDEGIRGDAGSIRPTRVAYHDACHALRAQGIRREPRALLGAIEGIELVEIANGDRCCGAAGIYNVTEPEMSSRLMREKAEAVVSTGAAVVASGNPGCSMQLAAGLRELGSSIEVVHPIELLDRAQARRATATSDPGRL